MFRIVGPNGALLFETDEHSEACDFIFDEANRRQFKGKSVMLTARKVLGDHEHETVGTFTFAG